MLHVIGLGVSVPANLAPAARQALQHAERVIGSERQLDTVAQWLDQQQTVVLPPLSELKDLLAQYSGQVVCLLASGDPLYYGIGRWLSQHYPAEQLQFHPGISSIQAGCHVLGLSLQDVQVVSLHGRPLLSLRRHLARHRHILCLTDKHSHPQALATLCVEAGFAASRLSVCEMLGYADQQIREFDAETLANDDATLFDALHVTVITVEGDGSCLPAKPGIPDQQFVTDAGSGKGLLTKREVRLAILGLLPAQPGAVYWDIGAGCGGVSVEWALLQATAQVYAIEHHAGRLDCLQQNRLRFGVEENLTVVGQRAPDCLETLPAPDGIFIGGSDGELHALLTQCWARLPQYGVLVASAVTEGSKSCLLAFADTLPEAAVDTLQVAIHKGSKLAGQWVYRPNIPVTLFQFSKSFS